MGKIKKFQYKSNEVKNVESIGVSNINVRFLLTIETTAENENKILVIMKNPSKATNTISDKTINNVIKNLYQKYSIIYIMNLFPYYSTKATGLLSFFKNVDNEFILKINDLILDFVIRKTDDILVGWGINTIGMKNVDYDNRISNVIGILSNHKKIIYYVHCCLCKNNVQGCANNDICTCRCKNRCSRNGSFAQHSDIRYPMHLELWSNNKTMIKY